MPDGRDNGARYDDCTSRLARYTARRAYASGDDRKDVSDVLDRLNSKQRMEVTLSSSSNNASSHGAAPDEIFLTSKEAARIARLHPVTLLRWAREGRVPHRRLSARKIVFPSEQLKAWLESGYNDSTVRAA